MTDIKAMVASLSPKMNLRPAVQLSEKKPNRGFVIDAPLREENTVAFISKKPMGKVITTGTIISSASNPGKFAYPDTAPETEIFATRSITPRTEVAREVVQKPLVNRSNQQEYASHVIERDVQEFRSKEDLPNVVSLNKSISKVSNLIKDWLHIEDAFSQVKSNIKDKKMYPETFYTKIQNCIYHSIRDYCGITKDAQNNDILPVVKAGMECCDTLVFLDRMFNDKSVSYEKDPSKIMDKYRRTFPNADGIQEGWIESFKARAKAKMPMDESGIDQVAAIIMGVWGCRKYKIVVSNDNTNATLCSDSPSEIQKVQTLQDAMDKQFVEGLDDIEDLDESDDEQLSVSIILDGDTDVVKIESFDGYGRVIIPFYTKLGNIPKDELPSISDDKNGKWDWLSHFVPNLMFNTQDPDKYLAGNDADPEESRIRFVIMDETDGVYVIGVYYIDSISIFRDDEDGEEDFSDETISMINQLVNMEVATGFMSHRTRSLNSPDLFRDEQYILSHVKDEDDEEELVPVYEDLATQAAIESMTATQISHPTEEHEEDHQMDDSIVTVGETHLDQEDEEDFTFVPIQKKQRLQD